jgi:hypothetical protein
MERAIYTRAHDTPSGFKPELLQVCIVYATLSILYVLWMRHYEKKHTAPQYSEYVESPRCTTMLAMRLTSLLRGFICAYYFRVKMFAPHETHETSRLQAGSVRIGSQGQI